MSSAESAGSLHADTDKEEHEHVRYTPAFGETIPTQMPPDLERIISANELIDDYALSDDREGRNIMRWNNMKDDLEEIIRKNVTPVPTSVQGLFDKFKTTQRSLYSIVVSNRKGVTVRIGTHREDIEVSADVWMWFMSDAFLNTPRGKVQEFIVSSKVHNGNTSAVTLLKDFTRGELTKISAAVCRICERAPIEFDLFSFDTRVLVVQAAIITAVPTGTGNLQLDKPSITHQHRDGNGRATVIANAYYFDSIVFESVAFTVVFRMAAEHSLLNIEFPELGFKFSQTTPILQDEDDCGGFSAEEQCRAIELAERHRTMIAGKVAARAEIILFSIYLRASITENVSVAQAGPNAASILFTTKREGGTISIIPSTQLAKVALPAVLPVIKCSELATGRIAGAIQHIWLITAQIERAWEAGCRIADMISHLEATDPVSYTHLTLPTKRIV